MSSRKISLIRSGENSTSDEHFFQGGLPGVFVLRVAEFRTIRNSEVLLASVKGPRSSVGGTPLRWH